MITGSTQNRNNAHWHGFKCKSKTKQITKATETCLKSVIESKASKNVMKILKTDWC